MIGNVKTLTQDKLAEKILFSLSSLRANRVGRMSIHEHSKAKLAKLLKKDGSRPALRLALRLGDCTRKSPCSNGACPVCTARVQKWYGMQAENVLAAAQTPLSRLSLVPPMQNKGLDILSWKRYFQRELRRVEVNFGLGGIDISYNEDLRDKKINDRIENAWNIHVWFVGHTEELENAKQKWKKERRFAPNSAVKRPVKIVTLERIDSNIFLYALKPNFYMRQSITSKENNHRSAHQNIRKRPLRNAQSVELAQALSIAGAGGRIIILGAQIRKYKDEMRVCLRRKKLNDANL